MRIKATTTKRGMYPGVARQKYNEAIKEGYRQAGLLWHAQFRPLRFTAEGGRMLGYSPRSRAYRERKRKLFGHDDPLVYTGRTRNLARTARILPTRNGLRIKYNLPALNFRADGGPNTRAEFIKVMPHEVAVMNQVIQDVLDTQLSKEK